MFILIYAKRDEIIVDLNVIDPKDQSKYVVCKWQNIAKVMNESE
jgi:hypothetical protein